jgi:tetratricopeptide (TPR) repeat protein
LTGWHITLKANYFDMATYFDDSNRIIIPRWREYSRFKLSAEHAPVLRKPDAIPGLMQSSFSKGKAEQWLKKKDVNTAWELVNDAYVLGNYSDAAEAALYLQQTLKNIPHTLQKVILQILGEKEPSREIQKCVLGDVEIKNLRQIIHRRIQMMKVRITKSIRSEFLWIELARLYLMLGQIDKAGRCVQVALDLSGYHNRFILRAASRFFFHNNDFDKAQAIVKRSPFFKNDPVLIAAEICYASKQNRGSHYVKLGFEHVDSRKFSNESITELSAMLGTLELNNGAIKSTRKMTRKSLLAPNDNSLAQAEWIARSVSDIIIDPELSKMEEAYEARAFENVYASDYNQALKEGLDWIIDQPFSKKALHFVSYLTVTILENYELARDVCEFGIQSNLRTFIILNNLIFAYASLGEFDKAQALLPELDVAANDERDQIFLVAIRGYIAYRSGDTATGASRYSEAIGMALRAKDFKDLAFLAEAYFARERFRAKEITFYTAKQILHSLIKNDEGFDVISQVRAIISSVEKINKEMIDSYNPINFSPSTKKKSRLLTILRNR